jgi:surface antigen
MVGRKAIAVPAAIAGVAVTALASIGIAAEASFPRLIAQNQTALLSYDDKVAAFDAETAVLSLQWGVPGHHWKGPDGAYGTVISGVEVPERGGRICRRFIHIVHHKDDGGANPTFQGRVCRLAGGSWSAE